MPIFCDPTEVRYLSAEWKARCKVAKGLEEETGADFLVSTLGLPIVSTETLKRHCQEGILIQRKTAPDLIASIRDGRLTRSLHKMLESGPLNWLTITGAISIDPKTGNAVMADSSTQMAYMAYIGALDWYQIRGGHVAHHPHDGALMPWMISWEKKLKTLEEQPTKMLIPRRPKQLLVGPDLIGILASIFPDIGPVKAEAVIAIAKKEQRGNNPPTLLNAMAILTDWSYPIKGVTYRIRKGIRDTFGLTGGPLELYTRIAVEYVEPTVQIEQGET